MNENHHNNNDTTKIAIQILGNMKYMDDTQKEALKTLSDYFKAQEFEAELYYREPGGMGLATLEVIDLFLPPVMAGLATNIIYDASKKAYFAISKWAKMRIKKQPQKGKEINERPVRVTLYGPTGELLFIKDIYEDREEIVKELPSDD